MTLKELKGMLLHCTTAIRTRFLQFCLFLKNGSNGEFTTFICSFNIEF